MSAATNTNMNININKIDKNNKKKEEKYISLSVFNPLNLFFNNKQRKRLNEEIAFLQ